jgi:NTE family protein
MTVGRSAGEKGNGLSFLTELPLGRLTPRGRAFYYPKGAIVREGNPPSEAAWFVTSGSCELRRNPSDASGMVLRNFGPGEAFTTCARSGSNDVVMATADSVLLCFDPESLELLRLEHAAQSEVEREDGSATGNGHHAVSTAELQLPPNGNGNGNGNGHAAEEPPCSGQNGGSDSLEEILSLPTSADMLPRQVVSLAFLSDQLPARLISQELARSVHSETGAAVVLVRLEGAGSKSAASNGRPVRPLLDSKFQIASAMKQADEGFYQITLGLAEHDPSPGCVSRLLNQLSQFRYVFIQAQERERPATWFTELLARSDITYLFVPARNEGVYQLGRAIREVRNQGQNQAAHLKPIACLAPGERIDGFDFLAQKVGGSVHLYLRDCPNSNEETEAPGMFQADIRRLAREVGGCMVGLALSSGAAKGFAHIGVIQVLEENGIEIDVIAGSSMGAYVGSLWAFGKNGPELEGLARELEGRWKLWSLLDPVFPPRRGFLRGFAVKRRLERTVGNARFADLVRPFRVVATNLTTLERTVFSAGEVSAAVHASIAVPGICVPITIDGETFIDGGIVDPLPVDVLRDMGVSKIIAVDAIPTPDRIRYAIQSESELKKQEKVRRWFRKVAPLDKQLNYFARGNLFEILMRSVHGAQIRVAEASCRRADLVLRPDILDDSWLDFRHPGKFIRLGREVAERHIEEIRSLVGLTHKNNATNGTTKKLATIT